MKVTKPLSQWLSSFCFKLPCHWLKGLQQWHITIVRASQLVIARKTYLQCISMELRLSCIYPLIWHCGIWQWIFRGWCYSIAWEVQTLIDTQQWDINKVYWIKGRISMVIYLCLEITLFWCLRNRYNAPLRTGCEAISKFFRSFYRKQKLLKSGHRDHHEKF